MFFRKPQLDPLPLTMIGLKAGERLLQIGVDQASLTAQLAGKVGMNGTAAHVTNNEDDATRIRKAAEKAGVLVDLRTVHTLRSMPWDDEAFDVAVLHSLKGLLQGMAPYTRVRCLEELHRVLRIGGRLLVIEPEPRGGFGGVFRSFPVDGHYAATGETLGALRSEGFRPVRVLADREGFRFVEGLKPQPAADIVTHEPGTDAPEGTEPQR